MGHSSNLKIWSLTLLQTKMRVLGGQDH
jgi:hypothetical protein